MMKKATLVFALFSVLFFTSCTDDTGKLTLNFQLTYDDAPMVMLEKYEYPTGETFFLSRVSFFVSNMHLNDTELFPIEYIDFTSSHSDLEGAKNGYDYTVSSLAADNYTNVNFALGVDATNNAKNPSDFSSSSALARSGEYWNAWESYVFYKIEGMLDTDGDGTMDQGISLHIGGDAVYNPLTFEKGYVVDPEDDNKAIIKLDMAKVFGKGGSVYDIVQYPNLHSKAKHQDQMKLLMNNTSNAITLE